MHVCAQTGQLFDGEGILVHTTTGAKIYSPLGYALFTRELLALVDAQDQVTEQAAQDAQTSEVPPAAPGTGQ